MKGEKMTDAIATFEQTANELGPSGIGLIRELIPTMFEGLDGNLREAIRAKARLTFGNNPFYLRDAVTACLELVGSWDEIGGASTRDGIMVGAAAAVMLSLSEKEFDFTSTPEGIRFQKN